MASILPIVYPTVTSREAIMEGFCDLGLTMYECFKSLKILKCHGK